MSEPPHRSVSEPDHNGERGPVPYREAGGAYVFDWQRARLIREWLDALHRELLKIDSWHRRP